MPRSDLVSLLSIIVGIGALSTDAAFAGQINTIFGSHVATIVLAAVGALGVVGNVVIRQISVPADTVSKAVAAAHAPLAPTAFIAGKAPTP